MKHLLTFLTLGTLLVSCSSNQFYQTAILAPANTIVSPEVNCTVDVITDVTLSGVAQSSVTLGIFKAGPSSFAIPQGSGLVYPSGTKGIVAAAWHEALNGTEYDVIINPKVRIEKTGNLFKKTQTATVVGYPGKFNFE